MTFIQYPLYSQLMNKVTENMDENLKRELHLARQIQLSLLNTISPELKRGEVIGTTLPARVVGGDYYDFYPLSGDRVRIVIGDVMGKGIPAAMLMILIRGAFRSAAESSSSVQETLRVINKALLEDLRMLSSFVTMFCADWDPHSSTLTYANAGHHEPFLVRDGKEIPLECKGVMLGGVANPHYQQKQITLKAGDCVCFYTDGIVEARNKAGEFFKRERLVEVLTNGQGKPVGELQRDVLQSLEAFTDSIPQMDDMTMVLLKI
ncbi:hypothetical protein GCM10010965_31430 [Caldalkalibacillus thermarum]|uniref:PP2C family protein-serine/threonine phosphatase n=1 Tax=Caldalkalibacillus thermarum TaxID=296745 RepID=UPI00166C97BC|nr:PP2C family protein-serine/threonine phosphatase [Caldalkalibacillus thermarum]GGK36176.1 hypothetical protein GCM10010965_31430 [Caldalkalibacillus thermarum]